MGLEEEDIKSKCTNTINDFYNNVQLKMLEQDTQSSLCDIVSRSTEENNTHIESVCSLIKTSCQLFCIPMKGVFLKKTNRSVEAFKYFICNTNFHSQYQLAEDIVNGHLVDMQPPFSIYLMIEIIWHCNFEDILAESILHIPLDICLQILEVLPRCIDLLCFERATKFLTVIIPNSYRKIIALKDVGSQTCDIEKKASTFSSHLIELIQQFMNSRLLQLEDVPKEEQYKRHGTLLKSIIQMVRFCLTSKFMEIEHSREIEKLYKLTFGHAPFHRISDELLQKLLLNIDRELISLMTKKVKEINCNIYIDWMEYDDEENTAITLQRAIGLECFYFVENTKHLVNPELNDYQHLVECLDQFASKPDNSVDTMQLEDLTQGLYEGRRECLVALFRRYKEWNDSIVDSVDCHISLLTKDDCENVFEYLTNEIVSRNHSEKLQMCLMCLSKALVFCLEITELYEIAVKFILKFSDKDNLENRIDITNFERFISLNSDFSNAKNLRVVLFFLCLKPKATLKILVKMVIGHADYPDVAVIVDDLMLLEPIMKIQIHSSDDTLIDALRSKCMEKLYPYKFVGNVPSPKEKPNRPRSVSLVVRILQDICLDPAEWNTNKFVSLLQALYTFCNPLEFVWEVFVPFLLSDHCTIYHLNYILVELQKLEDKFDKDTAEIVCTTLIERAIWLLKLADVSRYIINECVSICKLLIKHAVDRYSPIQFLDLDNYYPLFLDTPADRLFNTSGIQLKNSVGVITRCHQVLVNADILKYPLTLFIDDVIRFIVTKCTKKQYLEHAREMITTTDVSVKQYGSKANRCDWIIRLTLETCLLCLEFPMVAPLDSVSFLVRCLILFLSTTINTQRKLNQQLCDSLDKHLQIFKHVVQYTVISEAFTELVAKCDQFKHDLATKIKALEMFAFNCTEKNDKLRSYQGIHSPLGIKLYVAYDIVSMALDEKRSCQEKYIEKLTDYFKKPEEL